eukprot:XP_011671375.1 PREDICTED: uncharacterized protein LOC105441695 [Strongylocentrotus purpuratus]
MDDDYGGSQPPPPGTEEEASFSGALNKLVEEAVTDRRLLYPGLVSRMAPRLVPWAEVLDHLDRLFLLAVEKGEVGWVECLQEHLLDCIPHSDLCNRFPHPDPDRNICPREEGILSGKLYLDPGTPWWKPEMVETQQVSVALAFLSGKYREGSSRRLWSPEGPGLLTGESNSIPPTVSRAPATPPPVATGSEGVTGVDLSTPGDLTPGVGEDTAARAGSGESLSTPGNLIPGDGEETAAKAGPGNVTPGESVSPMETAGEDDPHLGADPFNRPEGYYVVRRKKRHGKGGASRQQLPEPELRRPHPGNAHAPRSGMYSDSSRVEHEPRSDRYVDRPRFERRPRTREPGMYSGRPRYEYVPRPSAPETYSGGSRGYERSRSGTKRASEDDGWGGPIRKTRPCPVPGCSVRPRGPIKWHIYSHMPECFRFLRTAIGPMRDVTLAQVGCLRYIAKTLTGSDDLQGLKSLCAGQTWEYTNDVPEHLEREAQYFLSEMHWKNPGAVIVHPPNSPAALLHWRWLAFLTSKLTTPQWRELQRLGRRVAVAPRKVVEEPPSRKVSLGAPDVRPQASFDAGSDIPEARVPSPAREAPEVSPMDVTPPVSGSEPAPESTYSQMTQRPAVPRAFDSHFHLDRMESVQKKKGMECVTAISGRAPNVPVRLCGGVMNYVDPRRFHEIRLPADPCFPVSVGIHPKHAGISSIGWRDVDLVADMVCGGQVVAIGEMGLDFSVAADRWEPQRRLLAAQLAIGCAGRVLILHLRGEESDPLGIAPSRECRRIVGKHVTRHQRIHIHCCSLGSGEIAAWRKEYQHVYFGFTPMVSQFSPAQLAALKQVPLDRLLLETDSPYFPPQGVKHSTPAYIGEVGAMVASAREEPLLKVLEATTKNGLHLYKLR